MNKPSKLFCIKKTYFYSIVLLCTVFFHQKSFSQEGNGVFEKILLKNNVKPPEISSLSVDISYDNVDLSKGIVQPQIPFFSIGNNDLFDNVSLNYVSGSGIRVNDYASDVGLGWDLNMGGYIVREVRGIPDDAVFYPDGPPEWQEGDPLPSPYTINVQSPLNGWLDYANWGGILVGGSNPNDPFAFAIPVNPINNNTIGHQINSFVNNFNNDIITNIRIRPSFTASLSQDLSDITANGVLLPLIMDGQPDVFYYKCPGGPSGKFIFDENGVPTPIPYNPNIKISPPIGPEANNEGEWIIIVENGTKFHFPHNSSYYEVMTTETSNYPYTDDWHHYTPDRDEGVNISRYISKWYISKAESITGNTLDYTYTNEPRFETETKVSVQQDFHEPTQYEGGVVSTPPSPVHVALRYGSSSSTRTTSRDRKEYTSHKKRLSSIASSNGSSISLLYNGAYRQDVKNQKFSLGSISLRDMNNTEVMQYIFSYDYFNTPSVNGHNGKRLKLHSLSKRKGGGSAHTDYYKFDYYDSTILPERNSHQQDYWGYFNANPVNTLIPALNRNTGSASRRDVPGGDRSPNEFNAKSCMLKEITFPTGGVIEYDYELNDYKNTWFGNSTYGKKKVSTGGLRIKSITEKEIENNPIVKNFIYTLPDYPDTSSGQIPLHLQRWRNYGAGRLFDKNKRYYWHGDPKAALYITRYTYTKYLQASDLIRYSHVTVDINENNKTEYRLTAFDDYPDIEKTRVQWEVPTVSLSDPDWQDEFYALENFITYQESTNIPGPRWPTPTTSLTDKSHLRGLILNVKEYKDGVSTPVRETINTYAVNPNGFQVRKIYALDSNTPDDFFGEAQDWYEFDLNTLNFDISSHDLDLVFLEKKEVKELGDNGGLIETSYEYSYNNEFNVLTEEKLINSDLSEIRTKKYYPFDTEASALAYMSELVSQNRGTIPVIHETYKDNLLTSKSQMSYDEYDTGNGNSAILPKSLSMAKGNNSLHEEYVIRLRDSKGNQLEFSKTNGRPIVYVWGYNKTYPIAKIENATFEPGMSNSITNAQQTLIDGVENMSNNDIDDASEDALRSELQLLREGFPNAMVTTYTYDSLIGITSMTSPKGYTTYYEYDEFNRLKQVKDADGNLISKTNYNYKN